MDATCVLLQVCQEFATHINHFVFASSSMVYSNSCLVPFSEQMVCIPVGVYAQSKLDCETRLQSYAALKIFPVSIVRLFSVYGEDGRPDMAVLKFLQSIHRYQPCTIYGKGSQSRDFTYISDVVDSLFLISTNPPLAESASIINIGKSESHSILHLAEVVAKSLKRPLFKQFESIHPGASVEPECTRADITKLMKVYGFEPRVTLVQGIQSTVSWFLKNYPFHVVTIIATQYERLKLLATRCLPSILNQSLLPECIVIVFDSNDSGELKEVRAVVDQVVIDAGSPCQVLIIPNHRTPGASGAWNTGIEFTVHSILTPKYQNRLHLSLSCNDLSHAFISIIDDDDSWEPNHLFVCREIVQSKGSTIVVTGLIRHESDTNILHLGVRDSITVDDFLPGNRGHVQGSNMFIRCDIFGFTGLFDENLKSCTDRDLLVRMLDLKFVNIDFVPQHTVHHYAEIERLRLSTPGSSNKLQGLTQFWTKYKGRMNELHQQEFCDRAINLFNWKPSKEPPLSHSNDGNNNNVPIVDGGCLLLLVGLITDSTTPQCEPLLNNLLELSRDLRLEVFILENGPRNVTNLPETALSLLVNEYCTRGLQCCLISVEMQTDLYRNKRLNPSIPEPVVNKRLPISHARTILQQYVASVAKELQQQAELADLKLAVLIVDDDKRFQNSSHSMIISILNKYAKPSSCNEYPIDALFGTDVDSPPLPEPFVVRTQLVDLYHLLVRFSQCDCEGKYAPEAILHNLPVDIYHDLGDCTQYLETPLALNITQSSNLDIFEYVSLNIDTLINGGLLFRNPSKLNVKNNSLIESYYRGGFTFVFNVECLLQVPNLSPTINGVTLRRSDMNWALINQLKHNRKFYLDFSVQIGHNRGKTTNHSLSVSQLQEIYNQKVLADVQGQAVTRSIYSTQLFSATAFEQFWLEYTRNVQSRTTRFVLSLYRVQGLIAAIQNTVTMIQQRWTDHRSQSALSRLVKTLATLQSLYSVQWWQQNCIQQLYRSIYAESSAEYAKPQLRLWFQSVPSYLLPVSCKVLQEHRITMAER